MENTNQFRTAARQCVEAAYRCVEDTEAASTLLVMAEKWFDLAAYVEHRGHAVNHPSEVAPALI